MALTRDFKETIKSRFARDPAFRKELLIEGIESFLSGDVDTGKAILRDYINATVGFGELAEVVHRSAQEHHAHVWPQRQSAVGESLRDSCLLQREAGVHQG